MIGQTKKKSYLRILIWFSAFKGALVEVHAFVFLLLGRVLLESLDEGLHVSGRGSLDGRVAKLELANERGKLPGLEAAGEKAQGLAKLKDKNEVSREIKWEFLTLGDNWHNFQLTVSSSRER